MKQDDLPDFKNKASVSCVSIVNLHQTSSQLAESPVPQWPGQCWDDTGPRRSVLHSDDELKEMRE